MIRRLTDTHTMRAVLALLVVVTYCALAATNRLIPGIEGLAGMALGFYFRSRSDVTP
jgi:hypothetical protein